MPVVMTLEELKNYAESMPEDVILQVRFENEEESHDGDECEAQTV